MESAMAEQNYQMTPFLDAFARQGLFFNRAYATGTRTVRGLEAISASFPPIPSESIIKRPGSDTIATWGKVMQENGYHTSFLYGGYGQFDNMNAYFKGNGFAISDRLDIQDPIFTNIWGVSDQDLFRHACSYFDTLSRQKKPFFSLIMTTSNHSPYTFPAGIPGVAAKGGGRNEGVLYADYSLAGFFAAAQKHSWYADTLFVIVADHGARVYGEAQIPLASYEIPLLITAPKYIPPRQIQTPISQMDIAPTVLGLLGLPYTAPFLGRDVLAQHANPPTLLFNHNHDVALYTDDKLVVLGLHNQVNTYRYRLGSKKFTKTADKEALTDLATAYYQCAFELFTEHRYQ
jgi:phosphoglycerol transferase MdoB-like AlkP superfamily enzyme